MVFRYLAFYVAVDLLSIVDDQTAKKVAQQRILRQMLKIEAITRIDLENITEAGAESVRRLFVERVDEER